MITCRRELNNLDPGESEMHKNQTQIALDCGDAFGKPVSTVNMSQRLKNSFRMEPTLEPKAPIGGDSFTYFHPWVDKVAQVVPNGAK